MHTLFDYLALAASFFGCIVPVIVFGLDRVLRNRDKFVDSVNSRLSKIEKWITGFAGSESWKG